MSGRPEIFILGGGDQQITIDRRLWADAMNALGFDSDGDVYMRLLLAAPLSWESDLKIPESVLAEYEQAAEEMELEEAAASR